MLNIRKQTNDGKIDLSDWQLLAQVSQMFRSVSDTYADQVDIPRGQANVLCKVANQDGLTQSEIAEKLSVRGATVTNMLQHLEEAGLVTRRRDPNDNRLVRVYITPAGDEKERSINHLFGDMQELIFKDISEKDLNILRETLQQIIKNIGE